MFPPYGPVVQLVRTLACHARGRRFEPVPGRQIKTLPLRQRRGNVFCQSLSVMPKGFAREAFFFILVSEDVAGARVSGSAGGQARPADTRLQAMGHCGTAAIRPGLRLYFPFLRRTEGLPLNSADGPLSRARVRCDRCRRLSASAGGCF